MDIHVTSEEYKVNGKLIQATVYSKKSEPEVGHYLEAFTGTDGDTVYVTNDVDAATGLIELFEDYNFEYVEDNYDIDNIQMIRVGDLYIFLMISDGLFDALDQSIMTKELEKKFVLFGADVDDICILDCLGILRNGGEDAIELAEDWIERLYEYMPGPTSLVDDILIEFNNNADDWIEEFKMDYSE